MSTVERKLQRGLLRYRKLLEAEISDIEPRGIMMPTNQSELPRPNQNQASYVYTG